MRRKLSPKKADIAGLIIKRKRIKRVMILNGILSIKRTLLSRTLPYDKSKERAEIVPLDELLQMDKLPFKMTKSTMLEVAYMGQMMNSYEQASIELEKKLGYEISATLVRKVTIFVGNLIYQNDLEVALNTKNNMVQSIDYLKNKRKGILYIMMDGAALNTRVEDKTVLHGVKISYHLQV